MDKNNKYDVNMLINKANTMLFMPTGIQFLLPLGDSLMLHLLVLNS